MFRLPRSPFAFRAIPFYSTRISSNVASMESNLPSNALTLFSIVLTLFSIVLTLFSISSPLQSGSGRSDQIVRLLYVNNLIETLFSPQLLNKEWKSMYVCINDV
ncbi:hypothetical protein V8G54_034605 [Vigna mungo]|uniref:Uncharacterized protein n=1 Tax=Vigna mungo TaxID=3915 RepID=A0AAQ3RJW0_VIGMU